MRKATGLLFVGGVILASGCGERYEMIMQSPPPVVCRLDTKTGEVTCARSFPGRSNQETQWTAISASR
jgi:hypothetical protein